MRAQLILMVALTAAGCAADEAPPAPTADDDYDDQLEGITPEQDQEASLLDDAASQPADDVIDGDEGVTPPDDDDSEDIVAADDAPAVTEAAGDDVADAANPIKIKYVLVIVKENHTFDNYFTGFPG